MSHPPGTPYGQNPYGQSPYGQGQAANPYGQQPQPGYGYPQQGQNPYGQPQQGANPYGQPAYGYPQAPYGQGQAPYGIPHAAAYAQPPGAPGALPGPVKNARTMTIVLAVFSFLAALVLFAVSGLMDRTVQDSELAESSVFANFSTGIFITFGAIALVVGVLGLYLGAQFTEGGNKVRVCGIVYASFTGFMGLVNVFSVVGLPPLVLGILAIVMLSKPESAQWFNRPRH
ncbi:hypothetical protein [Streptomyces sp. ODS28]|uniref:hypothetical protein n=1 Tax=Streptomyces sp. ODS28 TaxID=3136688 RepID=UPI0031EAD179